MPRRSTSLPTDRPAAAIPRRPQGSALGVGLLLTLAAIACGAPERTIESDVRYEPPGDHRIVVETVVDLPFEAAWSELIRRLSESSFRVSTLEKASRFVRVDLDRSTDGVASANQPARFVDCGRTVRTYQPAANAESERFEYAVADSSRYLEADPTEDGFRVSDVERRVTLDASGTIYLQPEGKRRTRVTVKSRYQVQISVAGTATEIPRDAGREPGTPVAFGPRVESVRFTTFQPGSDRRDGGVTCRATGEFEHALIALANPAAAI